MIEVIDSSPSNGNPPDAPYEWESLEGMMGRGSRPAYFECQEDLMRETIYLLDMKG